MATSLATLRPTFATFYGLLSDEQKARLVAKTASTDTQPRSDEKLGSHQSQELASRHGDSYCQQWVLYLKSVSMIASLRPDASTPNTVF